MDFILRKKYYGGDSCLSINNFENPKNEKIKNYVGNCNKNLKIWTWNLLYYTLNNFHHETPQKLVITNDFTNNIEIIK